MNCHHRSLALFVCLIAVAHVPVLNAQSCTASVTSFEVRDGPESRLGSFVVGYAFGGSTSSGTIVVEKNGVSLHAARVSGTGTITFSNDVHCIHGRFEWKARAISDCPGAEDSETTVKEYDSRPSISIASLTFTHNGQGPLMNVTVDWRFPYTDPDSESDSVKVVVYLDGQPVYSEWVYPWPWTGTGMALNAFGFPCLPSGAHTVAVVAESCIEIASAPYEFEVRNPEITSLTVESTDASGGFRATVGYVFETTSENSNHRSIDVYWNGGRVGGGQMPTPAGTFTVDFNKGCLNTPGTAQTNVVKAIAIACNRADDPAFRAERQTTMNLPATKGSIAITGLFDPPSGDVKLKVTHALPPGVTTATREVHILSFIDDQGVERPGTRIRGPDTITTATPTTLDFSYTPLEVMRTIKFVALLSACNWQARGETTVECPSCVYPPTATPRPVSFGDGNMRYEDSDPLPPLLDSISLTRNYDTHHHIRGAFGRGWVSIFERRLFVDADPAGDTISMSDENNDSTMFFRSHGVYTQRWPKEAAAPGTLTLEGDLYVHRPAGSTRASLYRTSDGRFVGFWQLGTGREMRITWSATGLPQSVTDSWTSLTWNITTNATTKRITSIEAGGLLWQYGYTNDNLTEVLAPGSATWRTYEYVSNRMTAARDASGNLIESHSYDASGRAVDSTAAGEEIQTIEYNAPGTTESQLVTRMTLRSGAISEYTLQPIAGTWRTVKITGGCASCGARDGVFAYDSDGHLIREQNASGYITVRSYEGQRLTSIQEHMRPAGCDPETSPTRCMETPATLATTALESTSATLTQSYEYGDLNWPDRLTAVETPSIAVSGRMRREETFFHPATADVLMRTIRSWSTGPRPRGDVPGTMPVRTDRTTLTKLYDAPADSDDAASWLAPAFDPGGNFSAAWLSLPQPMLLRKSIDGPRTDVEDVTSFVYYPVDDAVPAKLRGKLAATRNALGHITRFEDYDLFGNVTRVVNPNGVVTESTTDDLGRLKTQTVKGVPGCDTGADPLCATDLSTTRVYSPAAGPLQSEQRPGGGVTVFGYDSRGRIVTMDRGPSLTDLRERIETTWDAATGKKSQERLLAFEGGTWVEKKREAFAYDTFGQLQTMTHPDGASIGYTYDQEKRLSGVRDENHTSPNTTYTFDPAGRIATVKQSLGSGFAITRYAHDIHGNLISVIDPNGNETRYTFDDFGDMLSQQSLSVTGTTSYEYDAAGNLTKTTDANGAVTTRTYDALGRVLTAVSTRSGSAPETVSRTYDDSGSSRFAMGRLALMTDPAGSTAYSYERRGLLRREQRTFTGTSDSSTTTFTFDADGNRTSIGYPSGRTVQYTFDYAGRPINATSGAMTLASSAQYLPFGPMRSVTFGNGTQQAMLYDTRYRMIENKLSGAGGTLAEHDYSYDAAGNITAIADALEAGYSRSFGYDDLNRLMTADTGMALWGSGSFTYDAMGNMLSTRLGQAPSDLVREAYFTYVGTTPKIATVRRTSVNDPGEFSRFRTQSVGYQTVTYDNAGNEVTYVATRTWSPRNLLQSVTDAAETVEDFHRLEYQYDGRGVRVIRAETQPDGSLARRYYTYSSELQLLSFTRDDLPNVWGVRIGTHALPATKHDFVWFAGRPLAQLSPDFNDGPHWYFADHLGTPLLQTNNDGAIVWHAEYEPYGDVWTLRVPADSEELPITPPEQPLRFPGQELAMKWEGTEERYNIARWYRAGWGRYTQADPIEALHPLEPNLYLYVRARPTALADPLGLFSIDAPCRGCAGGYNFGGHDGRAVERGATRACAYSRRPKCRKLIENLQFGHTLDRNREEPLGECMDRLCSRDLRIYCARNTDPAYPEACARTNAIDRGSITLLRSSGSGNCYFDRGGGWSHTIFHEMVHVCGLNEPGSESYESGPYSRLFQKIVWTCAGVLN